MITYQIRKPFVLPTYPQHRPLQQRTYPLTTVDHEKCNVCEGPPTNLVMCGIKGCPGPNRQQHWEMGNPPTSRRFNNKVLYSRWLDSDVLSRFKVGMLVTLMENPIVQDEVPYAVFRIVDFTEIHYLAALDPDSHEPKAINVQSIRFPEVAGSYSPQKIRSLTTNELHVLTEQGTQHVHLRDSQTQSADGEPTAQPEVTTSAE